MCYNSRVLGISGIVAGPAWIARTYGATRMATIKNDIFHGMVPRRHPSLLDDGFASYAQDCTLKSGKLRPFRVRRSMDLSKSDEFEYSLESEGLRSFDFAKTLHVWKTIQYEDGNKTVHKDIMAFGGDVDIARSNIADDDIDRIFVSGHTQQESAASGNAYAPYIFYKLNDPIEGYITQKIPLSMEQRLPAINITQEDPPVGEELRYTMFFQTWVNRFGYESQPSPTPDEEFVYVDGQPVVIPAVETPPEYAVGRRIYKVITGSTDAGIRFVKEFNSSVDETDPSYSQEPWIEQLIEMKDEDVGETMPEMRPAPFDLANIASVAGNFYCGFSPSRPRTVMFSERDMPYSWPLANQYDVSDMIVGLAVTTNNVFVLTDGTPVVLTGTDPDGMIEAKISTPAPCLSKKSICVMRNAVYYAGPNGIMVLYNDADAGVVAKNLTEQFWTKDQWGALNPSSCRIRTWNGSLMMFFTVKEDGADAVMGFMLDLSESADALVALSEDMSVMCVDEEEDALYYTRLSDMEDAEGDGESGDGGESGGSLIEGHLYKFNAGEGRMKAVWRSKMFTLSRPDDFSSARVDAVSYDPPISLTITSCSSPYSAKNVVRTLNIMNQDARRVALSRPERYLSFAIETQNGVDAVFLSTSMDGLIA